MFIEDNQALSENDFKKLLIKIRDHKIHFYLNFSAVEWGDKGFHFYNQPLDRNGVKNKHYHFFKSLLLSITKKHNIDVKEIYRMAINVTFNNGSIKESLLHIDHPFPHKQLLLYCNDSVGDTVIPSLNKSITPKENKAIIFDSVNHKLIFPENGIRIVCVFTFSV